MLLALLKFLPTILALIQQFVEWGRERNLIARGELVAIADAAKRLNTALALASAAEQEAAESHAKDPTDGAFDKDFLRD
jgi:hypothetical protein